MEQKSYQIYTYILLNANEAIHRRYVKVFWYFC